MNTTQNCSLRSTPATDSFVTSPSHSSFSQLNRTHPLKGRSAILGELQDNCFVSVVCGCGPLANHTYTTTRTGLVCLFDAKRLLDRFTETKVSQPHS